MQLLPHRPARHRPALRQVLRLIAPVLELSRTLRPTATAGGMSENVAGALCYVLGLITGILFLVLAPYNQNKFVRFHAFQAIFFHVAWIVLWIADTMMAFVLPWYLMSLIGMLLALGGLALWLILMFKAYNNERFKLPIIGDLAEKQA